MDSMLMSIAVIVYLFAIGYLGYRGYRTTHGVTDYLVGGRQTHPYVMAMSYGATFISTSAIVGFGGVAALYGMGLMWLVFLNIFVGIFIAFVFFGLRTRRIGLRLDAHTFPELLGRRFQSSFIQGAAGVIIFLFMPMYASAVLMGAAKFLAEQIGVDYQVALFVFSAIVAVYVIMGGLKGVMYTDALQATIMIVGMAVLLGMTYHVLGGVTSVHKELTAMASQVPPKLLAEGHQGWTCMPKFGSVLWWKLVSTIMMGVGIGVLAQPQLAVRYMTVKSARELNRAVPIGAIFILLTVGVAYAVGPLTNVYFMKALGKISIAATAGDVEKIMPLYIKSALPGWFAVLFMLTLLSAAMSTLSGQFHVMGTSLGRDLLERIFTLKKQSTAILITRVGVLIGILAAVYLGYQLEKQFGKTGTEIVARGTAIFFGLCACAFLPMYVGALWSRGMTKASGIAGMLTGAFSSLLWMLFVHEKASTALLLCAKLFGTRSLAIHVENGAEVFSATGPIVWAFVDPIFIGLPLSILVTVVVSLVTPRLPKEHVEHCFSQA
ncbi:MAG: sodium:solute symporter family protein [Lentisphaerota bacterium]